jgi:hypothetical protein
VRIDAIELTGLNERGHDRPVLRSLIVPSEQAIFPVQGNLAVILPISGMLSLSIIPGIRCAARAHVVF